MTLGSGGGPDIITKVLKGKGGGSQCWVAGEGDDGGRGWRDAVDSFEDGGRATTQGRQQFLEAGRPREQSLCRLLTFRTTQNKLVLLRATTFVMIYYSNKNSDSGTKSVNTEVGRK